MRNDDLHNEINPEEWEQEAPTLASLKREVPYDVPDGYFDGLPGTIMDRIRSLEAGGDTDGEPATEAEVIDLIPQPTARPWYRNPRILSLAASILLLATVGTFWLTRAGADGPDPDQITHDQVLALSEAAIIDHLDAENFSEAELVAVLGDEAMAAVDDVSQDLDADDVIDYLDDADLDDFDFDGLGIDPNDLIGNDI